VIVATNTRVWGFARAIGLDEGINYLFPERGTVIQQIVPDPQIGTDTPGVENVFRRTAAPFGSARVGVLPQRESDPDDFTTPLMQQRRNDGRIDTPAHGDNDTFSRLRTLNAEAGVFHGAKEFEGCGG